MEAAVAFSNLYRTETLLVSNMITEISGHAVSESFIKTEHDSWTCYSSGESTTGRVMDAAENSSTPADILALLAESCDVKVRMAIADNRNAALETTMLLAQDEDADLRYQLAENHNIDESVLVFLADDSNPFVAHRARKTLNRLKGGTIVALPMLKVVQNDDAPKLDPREDLLRKMSRMVF